MAEKWYWLAGDSFTVANETERAYQLAFDDGTCRWIPKAEIRITEDKQDWEVTAWWIDKSGLLEIVTDEEAHDG